MKELMGKIRKYAVHLDWDIAFVGKSRGNRHLFRVVEIARSILKEEHADKEIVEAASWLHNAGLVYGDKNHDKRGVAVAGKFLRRLRMKPEKISKILHCIECHEGNKKASTMEAKIVHDADVIDKLGNLGIIRQTWKMANSGIPAEKICKELPKYMEKRKRKLYTKSAKAIARRLEAGQKDFFKRLRSQLKLTYLG
ncbi:MAG: HD domain-containing protein [Candidatus Aenigmarchaeota archaeon]|nr:HD domain-containing protein [Candidatus Aenigmarchaeota archaeon]